MTTAGTDAEAKARTAFFNAAQFHEAANLIVREYDGARRYPATPFVPIAVNGAFSLELYLKALLILETGSAAQTHDLVMLFSRLSADTQKRIRDEYGLILARPEWQTYVVSNHDLCPGAVFDDVLRVSRDAFAG